MVLFGLLFHMVSCKILFTNVLRWLPCAGLPLLFLALFQSTIEVTFNDKEKRLEVAKCSLYNSSSKNSQVICVPYHQILDFDVHLIPNGDDIDDFVRFTST
jgi:hypothetical protein